MRELRYFFPVTVGMADGSAEGVPRWSQFRIVETSFITLKHCREWEVTPSVVLEFARRLQD